MPANKGNLSTPHKEKAGNGLTTGASKKKKRCTVKHKKHCKQYLVSERKRNSLIPCECTVRTAMLQRNRSASSIAKRFCDLKFSYECEIDYRETILFRSIDFEFDLFYL